MVMASSATKEIIDLTVDPDEDSVDEDRDREDTEDWHFVVELSAATHRYTRIVGKWTRMRSLRWCCNLF
jgi:hypothetical protein